MTAVGVLLGVWLLIEEWAATRGTPEVSPFTQDVIDAIIDTIRAP